MSHVDEALSPRGAQDEFNKSLSPLYFQLDQSDGNVTPRPETPKLEDIKEPAPEKSLSFSESDDPETEEEEDYINLLKKSPPRKIFRLVTSFRRSRGTTTKTSKNTKTKDETAISSYKSSRSKIGRSRIR